MPELKFHYDDAVAGQDRIDQLLNEIHAADRKRDESDDGGERS